MDPVTIGLLIAGAIGMTGTYFLGFSRGERKGRQRSLETEKAQTEVHLDFGDDSIRDKIQIDVPVDKKHDKALAEFDQLLSQSAKRR